MNHEIDHPTLQHLEAALDEIRKSPTSEGVVALLVRRPDSGEREELDEADIDVVEGLVGDNWRRRPNPRTEDGAAHPDTQLTLMNARAVAAMAGDRARWALAGDQVFVDLDLSEENLPPGARLSLGDALVEVTDIPHTGCQQFKERFGKDSLRFVNTPEGRRLRLRGVYARVVRSGKIRVGDSAKKSG